MSTGVTSTRLVGRSLELAQLEAALADAADRQPSLAFVVGESGVGKSRLVSELQARAARDGTRVLRGDCVELGDGELAYAPLVTALRPLVRESDPVLSALPADILT
jgi:predicted ATPase